MIILDLLAIVIVTSGLFGMVLYHFISPWAKVKTLLHAGLLCVSVGILLKIGLAVFTG